MSVRQEDGLSRQDASCGRQGRSVGKHMVLVGLGRRISRRADLGAGRSKALGRRAGRDVVHVVAVMVAAVGTELDKLCGWLAGQRPRMV